MPLPASDRTVEWLSSDLRNHLVRKLSRRGAGHADAEDACQRAFIVFLRHRVDAPDGPEGDTTRRLRRLRLGKWLEVVAGRLLTRTARQQSRECVQAIPEAGMVSSPLADGRWMDGYTVREVLDRLDANDREILVLRGVGYGIQEIAERLGIPDDTAGKRLQRARDRFARALAENNALSDDGPDG